MRGHALIGLLLIATALTAGACSSDGARTVTPNSTTAPTTTAPATTTGSGATTTTTNACAVLGTGAVTTYTYARHPGARQGANDLDLAVPAGKSCAPVFVFVHGGGYCCGGKRDGIAAPRAWLLQQGWAVASVNYRLTHGPGHVRFPAFEQDVADAVAWLHTNGAQYGLDPARLVLAGHSTGAEMVALIETDAQYLRNAGLRLTDLRCAVLLDGAALDVVKAVDQGGRGAVSFYKDLFGATEADAAAASPAAHVAAGTGIPRTLIVVRESGPGKWASQQSFVAAMRSAGIDTTVFDASAITHGQVLATIGGRGSIMTTPVQQFLDGCAA